uniref:Uncharacterized protein n=1 Tax=Mycena chlorophos TaxID=658473 RepID=A0ABQ0M0V9_MYCCL|nr:predicted protein [Mycena chlorophos]
MKLPAKRKYLHIRVVSVLQRRLLDMSVWPLGEASLFISGLQVSNLLHWQLMTVTGGPAFFEGFRRRSYAKTLPLAPRRLRPPTHSRLPSRRQPCSKSRLRERGNSRISPPPHVFYQLANPFIASARVSHPTAPKTPPPTGGGAAVGGGREGDAAKLGLGTLR